MRSSSDLFECYDIWWRDPEGLVPGSDMVMNVNSEEGSPSNEKVKFSPEGQVCLITSHNASQFPHHQRYIEKMGKVIEVREGVLLGFLLLLFLGLFLCLGLFFDGFLFLGLFLDLFLFLRHVICPYSIPSSILLRLRKGFNEPTEPLIVFPAERIHEKIRIVASAGIAFDKILEVEIGHLTVTAFNSLLYQILDNTSF